MVYRDVGGRCLTCFRDLREVRSFGLRYQQCAECGSALVDAATFAAMWNEIAPGSLPQFVERTHGKPVRGCPMCMQPMRRFMLKLVPVDECHMHGIWFDRAELSTALAGAALPQNEWMEMFLPLIASMS
jgi:Zn-finger nucleic acid-binding protein